MLTASYSIPMPHNNSRTVDPCTTDSIAAARAWARQELRRIAVGIATDQGHTLGSWRDASGGPDVEAAYCRDCWRAAVIDHDHEPRFAGPALSQRCARPEAFLASQPDAAREGGR